MPKHSHAYMYNQLYMLKKKFKKKQTVKIIKQPKTLKKSKTRNAQIYIHLNNQNIYIVSK